MIKVVKIPRFFRKDDADCQRNESAQSLMGENCSFFGELDSVSRTGLWHKDCKKSVKIQ
jgi:hypothetical protein